MSNISEKLKSLSYDEKKAFFQNILNSQGVSISQKRDTMRKILVEVKDHDAKNMARILFHRLNAEFKHNIEKSLKNIPQTLKEGSDDEKIACLTHIKEERMTQYKSIILELLKKEKDPFVIATIISTLGNICTSEHSMLLVEYLEHEDSRVRANAVEALKEIKDKRTYQYIIKLLNDPSGRVKANVADLLKSEGDYNTVEIVKKMVYSGDEASLRSAVFILNKINSVQGRHLLKIALEKLEKLESSKNSSDLKKIGSRLITGIKNIFHN